MPLPRSSPFTHLGADDSNTKPQTTASTSKQLVSKRRWQPTCTHITVTRLYTQSLTCDICLQPSPWGWLYTCTQDREVALIEAIEMRVKSDFDSLGAEMSSWVQQPACGPHARCEKYSLLQELAPADLRAYTPAQLATLLKQRDHVRETVDCQAPPNPFSVEWAHTTASNCRLLSTEFAGRDCHVKFCHFCRPSIELRSYLSLNGIANGDVPATAAVGWGFHLQGHRPVTDCRLVENIGLRPVPLTTPVISSTHVSPMSSSWGSLMDFVDNTPLDDDPFWNDLSPWAFGETPPGEAGNDSILDGDVTHTDSKHLVPSHRPGLAPIRPPWTPPSSPTIGFACIDCQTGCAEANMPSPGAPLPFGDPLSGRSSISLKHNTGVRQRVFRSVPVPSSSTLGLQQLSEESNAIHASDGGRQPSLWDNTQVPYVVHADEDWFLDIGLTLPFKQETFDLACATQLPSTDIEEAAFFNRSSKTFMEEYEEAAGVFLEEPLEVPGGVALTEEAVESSAADILAQM